MKAKLRFIFVSSIIFENFFCIKVSIPNVMSSKNVLMNDFELNSNKKGTEPFMRTC